MNTLIIFDLDGTLADTREDIVNAVNLVRKFFKLPSLMFEDVVSYVGGGLGLLMTKSMQDSPEVDHTEACDKFTEYYNQNLTVKTHLYDGAAEVISELAGRGYYLAVLSNKPGRMCRAITAHFELDKYLLTTMGGGDAATKKPDPEGIYEIIKSAERIGFKRETDNIWMIGDHHTDMKAAENAELKSVYCTYGFGDKQGLRSDYEISDIRDLIKIV
jgi:phosphoglycolate phosphatase